MTLTLLTIAAILILVDLFLASDITTHVAYLVIAYVVGTLFEIDLVFQVLIGVITWMVVVLLHYLFFRKVIERFANRFVTPDRMASGERRLVHRNGVIVEIEGRQMLRIDGDAIPFELIQDARPPVVGQRATIVAMNEGTPIIRPDQAI